MSGALSAVLQPLAAQRRVRLHTAGVVSQVVAALVPAALLTIYALIPQPPYGARPFEDTWRRHLIVAAAVLLWGLALLIRRRLPRPVPLLAPLLLLGLIESIAAAAAPDWRLGIEPVLDLLAGIVIFAMLVDYPGLSATALRWTLALTALALAAACLVFVSGRWLDWLALAQAVPDAGAPLLPPTVPRVLGVGTNPNIVAPMMTLAAPVYLLGFLRSHGWRRAAVALGALVVQAGVFFTLSRSAWAGEAAGLALAAVLLVIAGGRVGPLLRRYLAAGTAAVLLIMCIAVVMVALGWRPLWLFRPTFAARSDFRGAAFEIIRAHPLLGVGPAGFSLEYPYLSNGDPVGAVHSHNVPIEIGVEAGLLGLFAALVVAGAAVLLLWRLWKNGDRRHRSIVACTGGALAGFAVTGMGDALHLFPEILFVLGALIASAIRSRTGEGMDAVEEGAQAWRHLTGRLIGLAPLALGAALLLVWFRIDQAGDHYARSIELAAQQRWPAAASEAERASSIDPAEPIYYVQAALSLEMAQSTHTSADGRPRAISLLRRALELEPRSPVTRLDLAALLEDNGDSSAALALIPAMVAGAPRDSLVLLAAGVMEESQRPEQAIEAYASALAESPRIADSPFWQETAFRRQHYAEIVQQALTQAGGEDSSSGPAAVREIIEQASGEARGGPPVGDYLGRVNLARKMTASGDYAHAGSILRQAAGERPDDPSARLALGELDAAMGDVRSARREWLAGAYLGDVGSIMHLGDTSPEGRVPSRILQMGQWALTDLWDRQFGIAAQHYRFAYRRQEPLPIVLPGDWLNALPLVYTRMKASVERWHAGANAARPESCPSATGREPG